MDRKEIEQLLARAEVHIEPDSQGLSDNRAIIGASDNLQGGGISFTLGCDRRYDFSDVQLITGYLREKTGIADVYVLNDVGTAKSDPQPYRLVFNVTAGQIPSVEEVFGGRPIPTVGEKPDLPKLTSCFVAALEPAAPVLAASHMREKSSRALL